MTVFRKDQNQTHSMEGNHIAGVATPGTGARQVEMWRGRMDANSATPPQPLSSSTRRASAAAAELDLSFDTVYLRRTEPRCRGSG